MTWLLSGKLSGVQIVKTVLAYVVCRENIWQIKWSRNTQQESSCHEMYQKSTLEVHRIPSFYCSYWNSWYTSPNICIRGSGKNQDIAPQLLYKWCPENVIFTTMLILSFYGCCQGGITVILNYIISKKYCQLWGIQLVGLLYDTFGMHCLTPRAISNNLATGKKRHGSLVEWSFHNPEFGGLTFVTMSKWPWARYWTRLLRCSWSAYKSDSTFTI